MPKNVNYFKYLKSPFLIIVVLILIKTLLTVVKLNKVYTSNINALDTGTLDRDLETLNKRDYSVEVVEINLEDFKFGNDNPFR